MFKLLRFLHLYLLFFLAFEFMNVPNFIKIGQTVAEIGALAVFIHLGFWKFKFFNGPYG